MVKRALVIRQYYSVEDAAQLLGETFKRGPRKGELNTQKVRRWLKKEGALIKRGRFYYATRDMLRRAFPEAWDQIYAAMVEQ